MRRLHAGVDDGHRDTGAPRRLVHRLSLERGERPLLRTVGVVVARRWRRGGSSPRRRWRSDRGPGRRCSVALAVVSATVVEMTGVPSAARRGDDDLERRAGRGGVDDVGRLVVTVGRCRVGAGSDTSVAARREGGRGAPRRGTWCSSRMNCFSGGDHLPTLEGDLLQQRDRRPKVTPAQGRGRPSGRSRSRSVVGSVFVLGSAPPTDAVREQRPCRHGRRHQADTGAPPGGGQPWAEADAEHVELRDRRGDPPHDTGRKSHRPPRALIVMRGMVATP